MKGPNFRSQLCSTAVERCPEHPGVLGGSMEQPYFVPDTSRGAIPEVPILGPPRVRSSYKVVLRIVALKKPNGQVYNS